MDDGDAHGDWAVVWVEAHRRAKIGAGIDIDVDIRRHGIWMSTS